jgi:hypothetical protein
MVNAAIREMSNPFLDYSEEISHGLKRRLRIAESRREKAFARRQLEQEILLDLWQREHRDMLAALIANYPTAKELIAVLENLPADSDDLIEAVKPWCCTDRITRYTVLHLINQAITHQRLKNSLPPLDDALPFSDEEPNVFLVIRELLHADTNN